MFSILVCEDDDNIRIVLRQTLEASGYRVSEAIHGKDGLELLRKMAPPCVVLLDIEMPEMDGYEFLEEKNSDPSIASVPVIVVSATADAARLKGCQGFLKKPFEIEKLLDAVERFCEPQAESGFRHG